MNHCFPLSRTRTSHIIAVSKYQTNSVSYIEQTPNKKYAHFPSIEGGDFFLGVLDIGDTLSLVNPEENGPSLAQGYIKIRSEMQIGSWYKDPSSMETNHV